MTPAAFQKAGGYADAFIAKLNPAGCGLVYSSVFGGGGDDQISDLAVAPEGSAYFVGATPMGSFGKLSADGSRLLYGAYPGGLRSDGVRRVLLDSSGRVIVLGSTRGSNVPTTADAAMPCRLENDLTLFSSKPYFSVYSSSGAGLIYSTFVPTGAIRIDAAGSLWIPGDTTILLRSNVLRPAPPGPVCLVNAAHYRIQAIAPGEIITIFGGDIGPEQPASIQIDSAGKVVTRLAGASVWIDGTPAPLLYVSKNQINAVVPFGVANRSRAIIDVRRESVSLGVLEAPVVPAVAGIFTLDASGEGPGAILNQDGTVNSPANPAEVGSVVSIYATGLGAMQPAPEDGAIPGSPRAKPVLPVSITFRPYYGPEAPAEILYAGDAPGIVEGVVQINARVPRLSEGGEVWLFLRAGSSTAAPWVITTVSVRK